MLIPLQSTEKGNLNTVGAGQLTSPKVVENLQQQPGKALPERKEITELQQRGLEQGQQKLEQQQAQLEQQKNQLTQQQQQLEQTKQEAAQAQAAAASPAATPEQKQAAEQKQAQVQQQEQAVQTQQQQVQQQEQAVAQQQQQQQATQQNVQQQRAGIAADEQALIQQKQQQQAAQPAAQAQAAPPASVQAPGQVLFIYDLGEAPDHLGKLVLIDRVSGKLLSQSDLNSVRGRTYVSVGNVIVVAAGRTGGNAAVRLVSVDPTTLAVQQQGKDNIVPSSYLTVSENSVYGVVDSGHGAFLARFDQSLALQAQSERAVDPFTYITVSGTEVFVQDDQGNILILNKDDLKEKKRAAGQPPT
jgi:hypothetical protein